jgi:sec-independent protein translocase protein TatA
MYPLFAFLLDDPFMLMLLGALAVLLYGERLPEVARSLGRGFMEFKRSMQGIQDEIHSAINSAISTTPASHDEGLNPYEASRHEDAVGHEEATAPKFEPPAGENV